MLLIDHTRQLYHDNSDLESVYALDSTTIDLCLSLFPWAEFRAYKGAIKLYTLMDLKGAIPTFIYISDGRLHDVNIIYMNPIMVGSIYIMDPLLPGFRSLHAMAYDAARQKTVLYGGSAVSSDNSVWEWNWKKWLKAH